MTDPYDDQLKAARYRAERDQARQELARLRGEATTMSVYDLLPDDDRELLWWAHSVGGLDAVCGRYREADNRRVELCSALGIDAEAGWSDAMAEMSRRLMPGGYEWPRYEDGEPVRAMDEFADCFGKTHKAEAIGLMSATYVLQDSDSQTGELRTIAQRPYGTPAVRAVLAADGEPLEVGQTVWRIDTGAEYWVKSGQTITADAVVIIRKTDCGCESEIVKASQLTHQRPVLDAEGNRIEPAMDVWWICEGDERGIHAEKLHVESIGEDGFVECSPFNGGTWVELDSTELYVHKPVLDADGVPIKVGDTVWDTETGCGRTVRAVNDNETVEFYGYENRGWFGKFLTHTKPEPSDSWELIEEDLSKTYIEYWGCANVMCNHCPAEIDGKKPHERLDGGSHSCVSAMRRDIMRRCRALAERGE